MSQFAFLEREWAAVFDAASRAEAAVHTDPRTACFYARRTLELAVSWAYKHDAELKLPYRRPGPGWRLTPSPSCRTSSPGCRPSLTPRARRPSAST